MADKACESHNIEPLIFILSGKRKSGKDHLADMIQNMFGKDKTVILRLSAPLKYQYAKENSLNYEKLLDASAYKEIYRADMIKWGEEKRRNDPGYFCRHTIEQSGAHKMPIWIVSDARRMTDITYFKEHYSNVKLVRISADEDVRKARGWEFVQGVDDAESECDLDSFTEWDFQISTNPTNDSSENFLSNIKNFIRN